MKKTEILQEIEIKERAGDFNSHVQPPNTRIKKVTPEYDYLRKGLFKQLGSFLTLPIFGFAGWLLGKMFHLKVEGRKNLKLVKGQGCILTTNHIHDIDCALVKQATHGRKTYYTVGEFNNYYGLFGSILRACGTLPFSESPKCMRNLMRAIETLLEKKKMIVFYPEGALWWCYEKPRPVMPGAYYYASKFNVPIVPGFFTFKDLKKRKDGTAKKQFIFHIGKPIYPKAELSLKENIEYLRQANFDFNKQIYESFYNRPLEYLTEQAFNNTEQAENTTTTTIKQEQ